MTPEEIAIARQGRYNGTVVGLTRIHSDLMVMRVKPDEPKAAHQPGQYCSLGLGNWEPRMPGCQEEELKPGSESRLVRRPYSLSWSVLQEHGELIDAEATDWLEFYIVLVRENVGGPPPGLTPRLFMLREGDRLNVHPKITGAYTLDPVKPEDHVIFLSTGTGEAPHNYMLWELLRRGHRGKILAANCVRYKRDLGYLSIQRRLEEKFENYRYLALTTREQGPGERKMYIQDLIANGSLEKELGHTLDPSTCHVFMCGNPAMIGAPEVNRATREKTYPKPTGVIELLESRGFNLPDKRQNLAGNIHFEKYW